MSESKHTPGPWRITVFNGVPNAIMAPHPDLGGIAVCILSVQHEIEANARLIAAAPELLTTGREANEAAADYAKLLQVENFDRDDIAVHRAYERLRLALNAQAAALAKACA